MKATYDPPNCPTCGETRPTHWAWCTDPLNKPAPYEPAPAGQQPPNGGAK